MDEVVTWRCWLNKRVFVAGFFFQSPINPRIEKSHKNVCGKLMFAPVLAEHLAENFVQRKLWEEHEGHLSNSGHA